MLDKIQRFRTYEAVVAKIRRLVDTGQLTPGDRLPAERELAAMLGTSRTTVREACRVLENMGLIESRIGTGRFITRPAPPLDLLAGALVGTVEGSVLLDFVQVRKMIESPMAALAARNATAEQIRELQQRLAAMASAVADDAMAADLGFHATVASASGNSVLCRLINSEAFMIYYGGRLTQALPDRRSQVLKEHRQICEAIAAHDPAAARIGMQQHLDNTEARLLRVLEQRYGQRAGV